ncbi:MAG: hypothetical protein LBB44_04590 [Endomicrobium sp.]|nr:hypothetical protein [Endomicrobium sp.]
MLFLQKTYLQLKETNKFEPIFKNQLLSVNEYLEVLLNLEKDKYSYGRGIIEDRYRETIIKLPV